MILKVCGMADPENISGLTHINEVDWMGMIFYPPSGRYVPNFGQEPTFYKQLSIPKVGVFVNENTDEILKKVTDYGLSMVQLHGDESPEQLKAIREKSNVKLIKVFRVGADWNWQTLEPYEALVDYFLFDTDGPSYGGTGHQFNWELLNTYPFKTSFLLSGGIAPEDTESLKYCFRNFPAMVGIDINSKFEISKGIKDLEKIKLFTAAIKDDVVSKKN
ncbi:phosphoribosylanthranilate isomerase [Cyclobacterium amurskyense]|uniref:phosphoribosylanthranilate isomerase n=1 Tax=Cyclobacterium amurskyense TaxID=320787 RepID=UPI0030DDB24A|tara:strand:+ start:1466 stop:2119 length:654 start_codon:yes stop_codon:yes gene_type:complete